MGVSVKMKFKDSRPIFHPGLARSTGWKPVPHLRSHFARSGRLAPALALLASWRFDSLTLIHSFVSCFRAFVIRDGTGEAIDEVRARGGRRAPWLKAGAIQSFLI